MLVAAVKKAEVSLMKSARIGTYALVVSLGAALAACSAGGNGSQFAPATTVQNATHMPSAGHRKTKDGTDDPTWYVYNYNNGNHLSRTKANYSGGTASFTFQPGAFTALLTTEDASLSGDLTGKTLTDTISVSGATTPFVTENGGGCGNSPAVRFYFTTPGFAYTHFWWSNPVSYLLANGTATLTAPLNDPSQWSDWNGQSGTSNPQAFADAVSKVNEVGLSYGGDCFFENGATVTGGSASFTSQFSEF